MPPKKKPGSAGKKKKGKEKSSGESVENLEVADKLAKALGEIDTLTRELALQTALNGRMKLQLDQQKANTNELQELLERKSRDRMDLTSDMGRQYKSMQSEMAARIETLETQVADLTSNLAIAHTALQDSNRDNERILAERDTTIEDQQVKMSYMSAEFESMLNETLAKMAKKLETVSNRWKESDNIHLSDVNQRRLADFHLTRLTLGKGDQ
ncbi:hypothetical protein DFS34DRAFT_616481 [Phlyctochytrium arcticum]|nr:hypothetical protein DFS34DRAFT_616481 [Phlyctochytrium arcticum]